SISWARATLSSFRPGTGSASSSWTTASLTATCWPARRRRRHGWRNAWCGCMPWKRYSPKPAGQKDTMDEMARFARPLAFLSPRLWVVACAEQAQEVVRTPTPPVPATPAPRATATPLPDSGAAAPAVADESAPSPSPTQAYDPDSPRAVAPYRGIWLAQQELEQLPMSGAAWENLLAAADQPLPGPDIADQDDMSDVYLLARALVYARTGNPRYREAVLDGIEAVMGTEGNPRKTGILA